MPCYEFQCKECGHWQATVTSMANMPEYATVVCVQEAELEAPRTCRLERILSPTGGKFGDTPRHHR